MWTCGQKVTLSMTHVYNLDSEVILCKSNKEMAVRTLQKMDKHAPIFTVGHNSYTFDNVVLASSLPKNSKIRDKFRPT
jgi:hypothetical protein